MIGRSNARRGARRIFSVLQNRRLNQHIIYTIFDEVCIFWSQVFVLADQTCSLDLLCPLPRIRTAYTYTNSSAALTNYTFSSALP